MADVSKRESRAVKKNSMSLQTSERARDYFNNKNNNGPMSACPPISAFIKYSNRVYFQV